MKKKKRNQKKQKTHLKRKTSLQNKLLVAVFVIGLLIGFGVGFFQGAKQVANYVNHVVFALMDYKKIDVDIDERFLNDAIFQYNNHIGGCLFMNNNTLEND